MTVSLPARSSIPRWTFPLSRAPELLTTVGPPLLVFFIGIGVWEGGIRLLDIKPFLLPAPHSIVLRFLNDFDLLFRYARATVSEAMRGLLIGSAAALVLAALTFRVPWIAGPLSMYSAFIKALPVISLSPIATVWFGIGAQSKIAIIALAVFPIVFSFALKGLNASNPAARELMRSYSAGHLKTFWYLDLPSALPHIFSSLRISVTTALIVAIIAEYFGGELTTLGAYIKGESVNLHTTAVWSAILMACAAALVLYAVVAVADRLILRWHPSQR